MDQQQPQPSNAPERLFEIFLYERDSGELPKEGTYYVVARNGFFVHKETCWGRALVPIKQVSFLREAHVEVELKLPKIPVRIIGQALHFFRKVWRKHKSEGYLSIYYSESQQEYRLWCCKQQVGGSSVQYDRLDQPSFEDRNGDIENTAWNVVGTIHSHPDFSAFHSGIDTHDEESFDGIHITLGNVNQPNFSVATSVAVGSEREQLDPVNVITGIEPVGSSRYRQQQWMGRQDATYYQLVLDEESAQGLVEDDQVIEETWMPKVTSLYGGQRPSFFRGFQDEEEYLPSAQERRARQALQARTSETAETTTAGATPTGAEKPTQGISPSSTGGTASSVLPTDNPGQPRDRLSYRILHILLAYPTGQLVSGAWLRQCLMPDFEAEEISDLESVLQELEKNGFVVSHPESERVRLLERYYWLTTATRQRLQT